MKYANLFIYMGLGVMLSACQQLGALPNHDATHLNPTSTITELGQWQLREGQYHGEPLSVDESSAITLTFQQDKVYGFSGVNQYQATVRIQGSQIEIRDIVTTRMAGSVAQMRLESAYLSALGHINRYQRQAEKLVFSGDDVQLQFINATMTQTR